MDKKLEEVGKISYEALQYAKGMVKPGAKMLDIAKAAEKYVMDKGYTLAFPTNISVNDEAAHYTPKYNDTKTIGEHDVVKVDFGARSGDFLSDCAVTVDLSGKYGKLVEATEKAVDAGISVAKAGTKVRDIGKEVEKIVRDAGFEPVKNLGGHGIKAGELHADIFIPNFDNGDETELEEGQTIAIEVFATDGEGYVKDGEAVEIFRKFEGVQVRSKDSREVASFIDESYSTYPFAARWLMEHFDSEFKVRSALNEFAIANGIETFPVLVERSKGIVAQTEKAMVVEKDSCTVITK